MTNFYHYGLFFAQEALERAPKHHKKAPFASALEFLNTPHENPHAEGLLNGYRYRLGDNMAGQSALATLSDMLDTPLQGDFLSDARHTLLMGQTLELIRPLIQINTPIQHYTDRANALLSQGSEALHETLWHSVVMMARGVITEDDAQVQHATQTYRHNIDNQLHPEGYMPNIVEYHDEVNGFTYQLQATQALVLIAEMAKHIGIDLYPYHKRGVSVTTAAAYPLYYYFYPEKWRWTGDSHRESDGVPEETAKSLFNQHGGFLEMIAPHYHPPLKAHQLLFDDLRPIFDPYGGGLTTLTHAPSPRRGLFG